MTEAERVTALEQEVHTVEELQQGFTPIEPLLGSLDSLLRFETVSASLKKKAADLAAKVEAARQAVTGVKVKIVEQLGSADAKIAEGQKKREKEVRSMEARTSAVETGFTTLKTETPKSAKTIEENSRKESREIAANLETYYQKECGKIGESILQSKESAKKVIAETRETARKAIEDCRSFDENNAEKMNALASNPPDQTITLEEAKTRFLDEISQKLQEKLHQVTLEFERKLDHWPSQVYNPLFTLISETDALYLLHSPAVTVAEGRAEEQLKEWNRNMRRRMDHMGAFARTNLSSFEVASLGVLTGDLAHIKRLGGLTEAGTKVLEEMKDKIPPVEEALALVETSLKQDIEKLAEAAEASKAVAAQVADQKANCVLFHLNLQKQVSDT